MDISTVKELIENINKTDNINLIGEEYILDFPLEINLPVDILGNGAIIKGEIFVNEYVTFNNISFESNGSIIFLDSYSKALFISCNFHGNNQSRAIYMVPGSRSEVSISSCKFKGFLIAIDVNEGNKLNVLIGNEFWSCNIVVDNITSESVLNHESIYNNNHYFDKEDIFIKLYNGYSKNSDIYLICMTLSHRNNYARIKGYGVHSKIDTSNIIASSTDQLYDILKSCSKCKNIFLINGSYVAPIEINKPVAIIGDENTKIKTNFAYSENCGIIINSSYVIVENLLIDGGRYSDFVYGIKCIAESISNIYLRNINITNISKKGIAFYSKLIRAISIEECSISHIKAGIGIYGGGNMKIVSNTFTNIDEAIALNNISKVYFKNNAVNLCNIAINCPKSLEDNLEILNCKFKTEKILLNN